MKLKHWLVILPTIIALPVLLWAADVAITDLTSLAAADIDPAADVVPIVDLAPTPTTKKTTVTALLDGGGLGTTDAVTHATIDTGQGANEVFDMDQNVATTSSPTFVTLTATTLAGAGGGLTLDATGFNGNLAATDNTLQEVAQKVDDLTAVPPDIDALTAATEADLAEDDIDMWLVSALGIEKKISTTNMRDKLQSMDWTFPSIDATTVTATALVINGGSGPTTDVFGETSTDNDAWAASRGAVQFFDGTANTYLLGVLASDTPTHGQVAKWNTGGAITWETPIGFGVAGHVQFAYNTTTTEPPAGSQLRLNNASQTAATRIWISDTTTDGLDVTTGLERILAGSQLYIQDRDDATKWVKYTVSALGTDDGDYFDYTVVYHSGPGNVPSGQCEIQSIAPGATGNSAEWAIAVSDETTALTTGTAKVTFRMPFLMTLTSVRASVTTAPTGATIIVDINDSGSTIMNTTKLSIDASEKTSTTAASAAALTDTDLADDAEITVDIDQIGSTIAGSGLKILLKGTR